MNAIAWAARRGAIAIAAALGGMLGHEAAAERMLVLHSTVVSDNGRWEYVRKDNYNDDRTVETLAPGVPGTPGAPGTFRLTARMKQATVYLSLDGEVTFDPPPPILKPGQLLTLNAKARLSGFAYCCAVEVKFAYFAEKNFGGRFSDGELRIAQGELPVVGRDATNVHHKGEVPREIKARLVVSPSATDFFAIVAVAGHLSVKWTYVSKAGPPAVDACNYARVVEEAIARRQNAPRIAGGAAADRVFVRFQQMGRDLAEFRSRRDSHQFCVKSDGTAAFTIREDSWWSRLDEFAERTIALFSEFASARSGLSGNVAAYRTYFASLKAARGRIMEQKAGAMSVDEAVAVHKDILRTRAELLAALANGLDQAMCLLVPEEWRDSYTLAARIRNDRACDALTRTALLDRLARADHPLFANLAKAEEYHRVAGACGW